MKYFIEICDLKILVNPLIELEFQDNMERFRAEFEEKDADVIYNIGSVTVQEYRTRRTGELVYERYGCRIYDRKDKHVLAYRSGSRLSDSDIIVEMNRQGKEHNIYIPEIYQKQNLPVYLAPVLGIDTVLPKFNRVMMHASIVKYEDSAILFTGPSGMGKSTQADLWKKYKGASIINGDRAILRVDDRIYAYGSPYAGSSGIRRNESVPVKMIVLLKQGPENKIRRISEKEAYAMLFPRFLMTKWDKELLMKTLESVEIILKKIPVYQLTCRPDKEAVELVHQFFR